MILTLDIRFEFRGVAVDLSMILVVVVVEWLGQVGGLWWEKLEGEGNGEVRSAATAVLGLLMFPLLVATQLARACGLSEAKGCTFFLFSFSPPNKRRHGKALLLHTGSVPNYPANLD